MALRLDAGRRAGASDGAGSPGLKSALRSWRLALPMYNLTPALAAAWQALLAAVVAGLRQRGWTDGMRIVPPGDDLMALWRAPDLLLSQTCGYPLVTELAGEVRVLAAPEFALPGCAGIDYCSLILVPQQGAPFEVKLVATSPVVESADGTVRTWFEPVADVSLPHGAACRLRVPGPRPRRRGRSSSVPPMCERYGDVRPASSRPPARCGRSAAARGRG